MTKRRPFQWWIPAVSLAVLAVTWGWHKTLPAASVGEPFRNHVKLLMKDFPMLAGDWYGRENKLPQEAVALLHLNAYISRQYVNVKTQDQVELLFEEGEDSRDMMGHYPPNCYPGNGWELVRQESAHNTQDNKPDWIVGNLHIPGVEYEFKIETASHLERLWVRNFFILPNNTFYPDLATFGRAGSDFQIRPYGSVQIQVVYRREYSPEDRERIFQSLMMAHMDLIDAVRKRD